LWTLLSGRGERRCKGYGGEEEGKRIHNWVTFSCPSGCVKPFKAQKSPVGLPGWFAVLNGSVSALRREVKQEEVAGAGNLHTGFISKLGGISIAEREAINREIAADELEVGDTPGIERVA